MSTRYVWGKYNVVKTTDMQMTVTASPVLEYYNDSSNIKPSSSIYYAKYSKARRYTYYAKVSNRISGGELSEGDTIVLSRDEYLVFSSSPITDNSLTVTSYMYAHSNGVTVTVKKMYDYYYYLSPSTFGYCCTLRDVTIQEKGTLIGSISDASQTAYPTDGVSSSYWYTYQGSDNIDPSAVSYSTASPKGGESITINVSSRSNTYGGTITYKYQVQLDGGSWIDIGSTTSTAKSYIIPKGTSTFRARVVASDNMGFTSTDYVTGNQIAVVNNVAPVISGSNQNLGVFTYNPPTISYVVTDENNDTVTVTVKLNSSTLDTRTVTLGQTYTVPISWWDIGTGSHTVTITADDGQGGTATRTYTFTKNSVGLISFNRLHKKTNSGYQTTYIETDSDSIITNNGQTLSERLSDIASKLSTTINTTPTEMVLRHRLHIKLTSEYTIDYLEMYSTNIKVGSSTLEEILVLLESKVGISNGGTVPSDLNFERWRMKNSSGEYDIIYLEGVSEYIICPCGKSVEERLVAIEAKL